MDIGDEESIVMRLKELEKDEPLLQENPRRFVMFPIQHSDIWQFYKKAEGACGKYFYPLGRQLHVLIQQSLESLVPAVSFDFWRTFCTAMI